MRPPIFRTATVAVCAVALSIPAMAATSASAAPAASAAAHADRTLLGAPTKCWSGMSAARLPLTGLGLVTRSRPGWPSGGGRRGLPRRGRIGAVAPGRPSQRDQGAEGRSFGRLRRAELDLHPRRDQHRPLLHQRQPVGHVRRRTTPGQRLRQQRRGGLGGRHHRFARACTSASSTRASSTPTPTWPAKSGPTRWIPPTASTTTATATSTTSTAGTSPTTTTRSTTADARHPRRPRHPRRRAPSAPRRQRRGRGRRQLERQADQRQVPRPPAAPPPTRSRRSTTSPT